jgi:hypothetical protein
MGWGTLLVAVLFVLVHVVLMRDASAVLEGRLGGVSSRRSSPACVRESALVNRQRAARRDPSPRAQLQPARAQRTSDPRRGAARRDGAVDGAALRPRRCTSRPRPAAAQRRHGRGRNHRRVSSGGP